MIDGIGLTMLSFPRVHTLAQIAVDQVITGAIVLTERCVRLAVIHHIYFTQDATIRRGARAFEFLFHHRSIRRRRHIRASTIMQARGSLTAIDHVLSAGLTAPRRRAKANEAVNSVRAVAVMRAGRALTGVKGVHRTVLHRGRDR